MELTLSDPQGEQVEDVIEYTLGNFKYIYTVSLIMGTGNGEKKQKLIFDTGSSLTWVNCVSPNFNDPRLFDGSFSPTYKELTRKDNFCIYPGLERLCNFTKTYNDGTRVSGILSRDTFRFYRIKSPFEKLVFGCAKEQTTPGNRPNIPGIFAMGDGMLSFARQLQSSYGNVFSYYLCGRDPGSQSFLTLGKNVGLGNGAHTTKFSLRGLSHYYIDVVDMGVNDIATGMTKDIFDVDGFILDTGSDLGALTDIPFRVVRGVLINHFYTHGLKPVTTDPMLCYNLQIDYQNLLPFIKFYLEDGTELKIKGKHMFYVLKKENQFCWAMKKSTTRNVIGAYLQTGTQFTYDMEKYELSFAYESCKNP